MLVKAIVFQMAVCLVTILWLIYSKPCNKFEWLLRACSAAVIFLGLWLGGVWVYPPVYVLLFLALICIAALLVKSNKPVRRASLWNSLWSNFPALILLPLGCFLLWQGISGRLEPNGDTISLASPFETGMGACVISGGISPLLNLHIFPSNSPRDRAQIYALDIIQTNQFGLRTNSGFYSEPMPASPENYTVYGTTVLAPCAGQVVEQENAMIDQPIGGSDKVNTGGNGVVLHCGEHHVHLHHMQRGSVMVELGDLVEIGQPLGKVGNSGNTKEPHLHLHAETIVELGNSGVHREPVHMLIAGNYRARGDCF